MSKNIKEQADFLFDIQERFYKFAPDDIERMVLFGSFATGMIMQFIPAEKLHEFADAFAVGLKESFDAAENEGLEPSIRPA